MTLCPHSAFSYLITTAGARSSALSPLQLLLPKRALLWSQLRFNSNRAVVAKVGRATYTRLYPTILVQPDGSTINMRYKEPRKIITLPFDIATLTEEEQRIRLAKRRPKTEFKVEEEIDDGFDAGRYIQPSRKRQ